MTGVQKQGNPATQSEDIVQRMLQSDWLRVSLCQDSRRRISQDMGFARKILKTISLFKNIFSIN